jgi:hypothetical protein
LSPDPRANSLQICSLYTIDQSIYEIIGRPCGGTVRMGCYAPSYCEIRPGFASN